MIGLRLALMIVALVLLILAACNVQSRINLTAAGLALWLLAIMVGG